MGIRIIPSANVCTRAPYRCVQVLSDTIPRSITSALVVLHGPDGGAYTYRWDGTEAAGAGAGDRSEALLPRSLARRPLSFAANATGDAWRVTLFATPALAAQYVTDRPRNTALAVIAASLACVFLFGCADVLRWLTACRLTLTPTTACMCQHLRVPGAPPSHADEQSASCQPGAAAQGAASASSLLTARTCMPVDDRFAHPRVALADEEGRRGWLRSRGGGTSSPVGGGSRVRAARISVYRCLRASSTPR
jgi:hypothetical protein